MKEINVIHSNRIDYPAVVAQYIAVIMIAAMANPGA